MKNKNTQKKHTNNNNHSHHDISNHNNYMFKNGLFSHVSLHFTTSLRPPHGHAICLWSATIARLPLNEAGMCEMLSARWAELSCVSLSVESAVTDESLYDSDDSIEFMSCGMHKYVNMINYLIVWRKMEVRERCKNYKSPHTQDIPSNKHPLPTPTRRGLKKQTPRTFIVRKIWYYRLSSTCLKIFVVAYKVIEPLKWTKFRHIVVGLAVTLITRPK